MSAAVKPIRRTTKPRAGRYYDCPDGVSRPSVTNVLNACGKPALITWAANQERAYVIEAAADLYEDCPPNVKMNRVAFITTLQKRLSAEKAGDKLKREAAEIGSQCHALVEYNLRRSLGQEPGPEPRISSAAQMAYAEFERWRGLVCLEPTFIEQMVFSEVFGYAGTLDLAGWITIPDEREQVKAAFRCPSDLSLEAFYQQYKGQRVFFTGDIKTSKKIWMEAHLQVAAYASALHEMGHGASALGLVIRLPKLEDDPGFEVVPILNLDEEHAVFLHVLELFKRMQEFDRASGWLKEAVNG